MDLVKIDDNTTEIRTLSSQNDPRRSDVLVQYDPMIETACCVPRITGSIRARPRQGVNMPTIIGYHDITKGHDHWLRSPKRQELFGPLGVTNIRTFVDPQNANRVAVLMDVPDMDALNAAMQSPAAAEAMAEDGVVPETLVILVEA